MANNLNPPIYIYIYIAPMVARIEMKLGMAYCIISMTITCFHDDRILFEMPQTILFKTIYFFTPQTCYITVARMEVKLVVYVYYIVFMTTTTTNSPRHLK